MTWAKEQIKKLKRKMIIKWFLNLISLFIILSVISILTIAYNERYLYFKNACHMAHKMIAYAENADNIFFVDRYMSDMHDSGCSKRYNLKGIELNKETDIPSSFQMFSLSINLSFAFMSLLIYYHVAFKKDKNQAIWKEKFNALLDFNDGINDGKKTLFNSKHIIFDEDYSIEYLTRITIHERNIILDNIKFLERYIDKLNILFNEDIIESIIIHYEDIKKESIDHSNTCNKILRLVNSKNEIDYNILQKNINNKAFICMNINIVYEKTIAEIKRLADAMK